MAVSANKFLHNEGKTCGRAPISRTLKFYTDAAGTVAAVVTDSVGAILTQPVAVDAMGQVEVYSDSFPLYYRTNAESTKVRKLTGQAPIDGIPVMYRSRHTAAAIAASATIVPNRTGYNFIVQDAGMKAIGGTAATCTTVNIQEETSGTVFLSHVAADLTVAGGWRGTGTGDGTNVITGITAGGKVVTAKKLLLDDVGGGALSGATHIEAYVLGYWLPI